MAGATAKFTRGWNFYTRGSIVHALRVAQGHTMPFFGNDFDSKPDLT